MRAINWQGEEGRLWDPESSLRANRGNWIQTFCHKKFYPFNPHPDDIVIEDVAHALSMLCRFNGHVREFYSVAQHSLMVSCALPPGLHLWGLLHDASEAYIADLARPVKHSREMRVYRDLEQVIMMCIADKFDLPWPMPVEVKDVDSRACATEARDLMSPLLPGWELKAEPLNYHKVMPLAPGEAEQTFLARWRFITCE